jgi:hypothetical protein
VEKDVQVVKDLFNSNKTFAVSFCWVCEFNLPNLGLRQESDIEPREEAGSFEGCAQIGRCL